MLLVAVLMFLAGAIGLVGGILLLVNKDDSGIQADVDATAGQLQTIAIVIIVVAALTLLVAAGLMRGSRLARGLVTVVMLFNIAAGVYGLIELQDLDWWRAAGQIGWAVIVLAILHGLPASRRVFRS